jgi:hypothetical protein
MAKPTPNLGVSKPKPDLSALRDTLRETAAPATHADAPPAQLEDAAPRRNQKTLVRARAKTQLVGAHLSPDVGKQLRMIAAEEDTDVKSLLIEAINLLFKTRSKPQIASDPIER